MTIRPIDGGKDCEVCGEWAQYVVPHESGAIGLCSACVRKAMTVATLAITTVQDNTGPTLLVGTEDEDTPLPEPFAEVTLTLSLVQKEINRRRVEILERMKTE